MMMLHKKLDVDGDAKVSFNEAKDWIAQLEARKRQEIINTKFGEYDLDGDRLGRPQFFQNFWFSKC